MPRKQSVKLLVNHLPDGWCPTDLQSFLGGSEECVVQLSESLSRSGYDVTVFHTQRIDAVDHLNGVNYVDRSSFFYGEDDIVVVFKDPRAIKDLIKFKPKKLIFWSSDVEKPFRDDDIDAFVSISPYLKKRNIWVDGRVHRVIPHGLGLDITKDNEGKIPNSVVYSSSPDRGLEELLNDWPRIHEKHPDLFLNVTYGFKSFDSIHKDPRASRYKKTLLTLMSALPNVKYIGQLSKVQMEYLYWRTQYWILPLNRADSELFCLNAVKSQYCGCKPIINDIGALRNTVGSHYSYSDFINGAWNWIEREADIKPMSWDDIVSQYWKPILEN